MNVEAAFQEISTILRTGSISGHDFKKYEGPPAQSEQVVVSPVVDGMSENNELKRGMAMNTVAPTGRQLFPKNFRGRLLVLSAIILPIFFVSVSIAQRSGTSQSVVSSNTPDVIVADPISAVGHGAALDTEGREIDVTPEFIVAAQNYYLKSLLHQADEKQRLQFKKKLRQLRRLLKKEGCNENCQVQAKAALIAWLIKKVKPENASTLAGINTVLRSEFASGMDMHSPENAGGDASSRALKISGIEDIPISSSPTNLSGEEYIQECRAAGVPIPPDWGSSQWQSRGIVTNEFISATLETEVFTFESSSPRGICFALPRSRDNAIGLLGIICQGSDTSKVCFWDNQRNDRSFVIEKNTTVPLTEFAGGAALQGGEGGVCSDCHAGENSFVVHPATPLDLAPTPKPTNWPDPLVHADWPDNPGPTNILDGIALGAGDNSCTGCHSQQVFGRFPQVSRELPGYCRAVLGNAIVRTMPPGNPGDPSYGKHSDALLAACNRIKGELVSDNSVKAANSPAQSFTPCFGVGPCPVTKMVTFVLSQPAEVFIKYDLGQSHGCCADHSIGVLRILLDGMVVHRDRIPFFNYGVQPISEVLEDFDYFFSPEVVKGFVPPVSQLDATRAGPLLQNYKIVNRFSLGTLVAGSYTVELQVGDGGWNAIFEVSQ